MSQNIQNNSTGFATMKSGKSVGLNLDVLVLFSLLLQAILAIAAPWRKHHVLFVLPVVWLGYLLERTVTDYGMGLIPNNTVHGGRTGELRVFWAPFLILHVGGPNSITGLSLADNELWLRLAMRLISLSYTFGRVFLRSFLKNDLWVPTAVVFLAGAIRYIEKVICRFLARLTKFRDSTLPEPNPGVNYAKIMQTYNESNIPVKASTAHDQAVIIRAPSPSSNDLGVGGSQIKLIKEAYRFFHEFRGLFVNSVYSYDRREYMRRYFLGMNPKDAFSICEVELNFAYDVFYTKSILFDKPVLRWLNLFTLFLQLVSTVLWIRLDKTSFQQSSVHATNALVYGSISLDLFSLFILATSDWDVVWMKPNKLVEGFFDKWLLFKECACQIQRKMWKLRFGFQFVRVFFRWSECIPQLNLISTCIHKKSMVSIDHVSRSQDMLTPMRVFPDMLRDFIFKELVRRSIHAKQPKDVEELCSARGLWILAVLSRKHRGLDLATTFRPWITKVDYGESIILWNIATTLCYYCSSGEEGGNFRECSNILADYMLHLLVRPGAKMITPREKIIGRMIFLDTCADAKRFFDRKLHPQLKKARKEERLRKACEQIIHVNTDVIPPSKIRGDVSKSVLFDGCLLAKQLLKFNYDDKWEIISKVWAEMLFYCATHSRGSVHLEKLGLGGELLTLVWLLMAHLGLGKNFRYNKD